MPAGPAIPPNETSLQRTITDWAHGQVTAQAIFLTIRSQFLWVGRRRCHWASGIPLKKRYWTAEKGKPIYKVSMEGNQMRRGICLDDTPPTPMIHVNFHPSVQNLTTLAFIYHQFAEGENAYAGLCSTSYPFALFLMLFHSLSVNLVTKRKGRVIATCDR